MSCCTQDLTIKNTWRTIGHFVSGEFGDPTTTQSDQVASIPLSVGVDRDNSGEEDEGVEYQEEAESEEVALDFQAREPESLFCRGCHLCYNLLDMEDEGPLFVVKLASEERAR
jgi:hypothetical protein